MSTFGDSMFKMKSLWIIRLRGISAKISSSWIQYHQSADHTTLLLSGKLNSHLAKIDNRAKELFDRLVKQLAEKEGITEQLKAQDQIAWVGAMNSIRNQAEEIINAEIIYT